MASWPFQLRGIVHKLNRADALHLGTLVISTGTQRRIGKMTGSRHSQIWSIYQDSPQRNQATATMTKEVNRLRGLKDASPHEILELEGDAGLHDGLHSYIDCLRRLLPLTEDRNMQLSEEIKSLIKLLSEALEAVARQLGMVDVYKSHLAGELSFRLSRQIVRIQMASKASNSTVKVVLASVDRHVLENVGLACLPFISSAKDSSKLPVEDKL